MTLKKHLLILMVLIAGSIINADGKGKMSSLKERAHKIWQDHKPEILGVAAIGFTSGAAYLFITRQSETSTGQPVIGTPTNPQYVGFLGRFDPATAARFAEYLNQGGDNNDYNPGKIDLLI
jgi:hypothetical protein